MVNKNNKEMMEEYVHNPIAHSCGKLCGNMRGGSCTHPCNSLCHPGPCPPCSMIIELPCQCGKTKYLHESCITCRKAVRCGTDPASIHCDQVCGKLLDCKEHTCQLVCHAGPCPSCSIPVECKCYCGAERKQMPCGETKMAICSRNPPYEEDLVIPTVAAVQQGLINSSIYKESVIGDLDGLSDLSDDSEDDASAEVITEGAEVTKEGAEVTKTEATKTETKEEAMAKKPFKLLTMREAGIGGYSCGRVCGKVLACQRHRCDRVCHAGDCGLCPFTVTDVAPATRPHA